MIAVDTSALVAIALGEQEADAFKHMVSQHRCLVGWPTLFETHMVLNDRLGPFATFFIAQLVAQPNIDAVAFDENLFGVACKAFDRYGRDLPRRHRLNFGDCMSYAVAKARDLPLLYKGDDFRRTDLRAAVP